VPVALCILPVPGTAIPNVAALGELCRVLDGTAGEGVPPASTRIRLALDPATAMLDDEDPEELLQRALEEEAAVRLGHVYLSDCRAGQRVSLGEGDLDWGSLSTALLTGGFEGAVSVLLEGVDPLYAEIEAKEAAGFAHTLFPDAVFAPDGGR
jgi:hypothetical protein